MPITKPRLLRSLDTYLAKHPDSMVLEVGFGTGNQSLDMAASGHEVTAITIDSDELAALQMAKLEHGLADSALRPELLDAQDIAERFEPGSFDVVVAHNVFHLMDKSAASHSIESIKQVTRKLGINAVGGYVIGPDAQVTQDTHRMFRHGELTRHYTVNPGWDIRYSQEDAQTKTMNHGDKLYVSSHTDLIAVKR